VPENGIVHVGFSFGTSVGKNCFSGFESGSIKPFGVKLRSDRFRVTFFRSKKSNQKCFSGRKSCLILDKIRNSLLNNYSAGDPSASRFITLYNALRKPPIYAGSHSVLKIHSTDVEKECL
jgi:hypothetical protein